MAKIFSAITLALFLSLAPGRADAQETLRIAAVVNDDVVSVFDLIARVRFVIVTANLPDTAETQQQIAPQALRALIEEKLKLQAAKKSGIEVSESEIADAVRFVEQNNGMPPGAFLEMLDANGVDQSALKSQLETEVAWNKLVRRELGPRIQIGDGEVDAVLARMEEAKGRPQFQVAEIFLAVESPEDEAEVRGVAERMLQELRGGASFQALARNFSQSPSAASGGDLGWIAEGQIGRELDVVLRQMSPGQLSAPIRGLTGYHILLLRDRRTGGQPAVDPGQASLRLSQLFVPVGSGASVEATAARLADLAARASDCASLEALGKETGSGMSGSLGTVKLGDLPQEIRQRVEGLAVNRPSQPMRTPEGVMVLMVCERIAPPAPRQPDRDDVHSSLFAERIAVHARRYLRDLKRTAIVDIRL